MEYTFSNMEDVPSEFMDGLSDRQKEFVAKAFDEDWEVDFSYSGRGMYGVTCPAVRTNSPGEFGFRGANSDGMGLGQVIYMR